jgi:glycosyltransferase involved in cell wall biosynthesis
MQILWFTGVQLPAVTGEDLNRAGWQEGLRKALYRFHPDIKLAIASFGTEPYEPYTEENATYYNIYREPALTSRWARMADNWRHRPFNEEELGRCLEIVEHVQPDLIFIFGTENPFGLLAKRLPVPVVISIQAVLNGLVERIFYGLSFYELIREFFSKDTLIGEGVFHRKWQLRELSRMEQVIYSRCNVFEGRTEWDKKWLNRLNRKAVYYHIDRVLADDYYQARWDYNKTNRNLIFTTSSNAAFKGGITLTRALVELKKRGRDDIHLRIAGVHPESIVGRNISRLEKKYQLQDQITLLDRVQPKEIIQEMSMARLFILPSHMDNSPNSLAEAMLMGIPCIASDVGGIPSMLKDGEDGLLYPHQDIKTLADKIEQLIDDPEYANKLGSTAREKAVTRHDPERIAGKTLDMYKQVVAGQIQARAQLPERRPSMLQKIFQRAKLALYVSRYGTLPEVEEIVNPYLSKRELDEILSVFPMPKFFIYGHARSGTTLLARLIRVHPEVHCNYQAHFFTREPTIHALVESPAVREWLSRPDNRWNQGKDLSPVILRIVADYIMEREAKQLGKSIVGDKSPNSLLDGKSVHKLYSIYPDAKLIYIARDGRDTILSHRIQAFIDFQELLSEEDKRLREDFKYYPEQFLQGNRSLFTREGLISGAQSWVRNMNETDSIGKERFGENYYSLKYEDLLTNPEEEMDKIWAFLGVDPDFPDRHNVIIGEMGKNPDADWQRHQEKDLVANLKKGEIGAWEDLFTPQDNQLFQEIAGETLKKWGYKTT